VLSNITVILPSLNPDEKLIKTVDGLIEAGFDDIVIINDGSDEKNYRFFPDTEVYPQCTVIDHWVNKGKGSGLKTAFAYVLKMRKDCRGVVTVDGDGQHRPEDVKACALKMLETDGVVLGARNFNLPGIPARSVFGNKLTSFVFKTLCGMKITDTQTGLRAIPARYLGDMIKVKGERFEYETNMLLSFKDNDIPYTENSIHTVYIEENKTSHFNPLKDSLRIYKQIFGYAFSSLSATAIDLGLFALLFWLLFPKAVENREICTLICSVAARVVSSLYNYFINFRFVFAKKKKAKYTLLKYYLLAAAVMILSGLSTAGMTLLLPDGAKTWLVTAVKAVIDTALFLLTFTVQREWVFGGKKKK